ncbi:MAG: GNAT family N-acetyltransferase [Eubacteriales bacterium]|nr:GNAT family N-acetyltransferase [Eubacteriales bacterium]
MISIKQATDKDIPVIEEIMTDVIDWLESIGQPQWKRQNVTWSGLSRNFHVGDFYIATIENEPVGCMALIDYDPTFWPEVQKGESLFIHKLAVKRCGAKQGVSKALISFAKEQAIKLNINNVWLDTHQFREKVRDLYEREGFVCINEKCLFGKYHTAFYVWKAVNSIINHYDTLVDENNDPVHDPAPLKTYMNKWDGDAFIEALQLSPGKSVLEIGVGTGRLAMRVCGKCRSFTGVDISPKTIERAKENLREFSNVHLICGNYLTHKFHSTFDVIYSSLTFMHIKDKKAAIQKALDLLSPGGRFVLSIDKNQQTDIDYGTRRIPVFPDRPEEVSELLTKAGFTIEQQFETEFAVIFTAVKGT